MEWINKPDTFEPLDLNIICGICPRVCVCYCVPPMKVAMVQDPD